MTRFSQVLSLQFVVANEEVGPVAVMVRVLQNTKPPPDHLYTVVSVRAT